MKNADIYDLRFFSNYNAEDCHAPFGPRKDRLWIFVTEHDLKKQSQFMIVQRSTFRVQWLKQKGAILKNKANIMVHSSLFIVHRKDKEKNLKKQSQF